MLDRKKHQAEFRSILEIRLFQTTHDHGRARLCGVVGGCITQCVDKLKVLEMNSFLNQHKRIPSIEYPKRTLKSSVTTTAILMMLLVIIAGCCCCL